MNIEQVKQYFQDQSCQLLEEAYTSCNVLLNYICKCGRVGRTRFCDFKNKNYRCGFCHSTGRKKKYTLEEVQQIFKDRGCELLDKVYKNGKTIMSYRCKCGNVSKVTFFSFHHQKANCYECGLKKISEDHKHRDYSNLRGPNNYQWIADRDKKRENELFHKKIYKALQSSLQCTKQNKARRTKELLGYGPKELQEYISHHPNYQNVKNEMWHLDHIFPIEAFAEHGITDLKVINALDNLQPMLEKENIVKGCKYDEDSFYEYLKTKGIKL